MVALSAGALGHQPQPLGEGQVDLRLLQRPDHRASRLRGEAQAEGPSHLLAQPTLLQVVAGSRARRAPEQRLVELGHALIEVEALLPLAAPLRRCARLCRRDLLPRDLHADAPRQVLHHLHEGAALDLHQKAEDVAALLATEAVVELALRVDVERRGLLVVEGAEALVVGPSTLELNVLPDDLHDVGPLTNLCNDLFGDPSWHVLWLPDFVNVGGEQVAHGHHEYVSATGGSRSLRTQNLGLFPTARGQIGDSSGNVPFVKLCP